MTEASSPPRLGSLASQWRKEEAESRMLAESVYKTQREVYESYLSHAVQAARHAAELDAALTALRTQIAHLEQASRFQALNSRDFISAQLKVWADTLQDLP